MLVWNRRIDDTLGGRLYAMTEGEIRDLAARWVRSKIKSNRATSEAARAKARLSRLESDSRAMISKLESASDDEDFENSAFNSDSVIGAAKTAAALIRAKGKYENLQEDADRCKKEVDDLWNELVGVVDQLG